METHSSGAATRIPWRLHASSNWCGSAQLSGCPAPVNAVDCKQDQEIRAERRWRRSGRRRHLVAAGRRPHMAQRATTHAITISCWWFTTRAQSHTARPVRSRTQASERPASRRCPTDTGPSDSLRPAWRVAPSAGDARDRICIFNWI